MNWLAVALGGAAGSLLRYAVSLLLPFPGLRFPWATFTVNVLGCFLIGLAWVLIVEKAIGYPEMRLLIMTGFLGGFTTFSAFSLEAMVLWQQGHIPLALGYLLGSLGVGMLAIALAVWLARQLWL